MAFEAYIWWIGVNNFLYEMLNITGDIALYIYFLKTTLFMIICEVLFLFNRIKKAHGSCLQMDTFKVNDEKYEKSDRIKRILMED